MNKQKIFNDPVYGFVSIPYGILFDLIEHSSFQRLRRIKQVGMTHFVYPGALHTRFHHALGSLHLMSQAIEVLRQKGTAITDEEATGVSIAILLHDIGHGPFSHALEYSLVNVPHEELSLLFMQQLDDEFNGALRTAMRIFRDEHPKKFLHQLVSGQLDMDRMDYLNRDSFFTGVSEGVIGYDRIIKMLAVQDEELVVEEKGIYSVEKFLIARRLMYWQVYLHKTVLSAEKMLTHLFARAKTLARQGTDLLVSPSLAFFLYNEFTLEDLKSRRSELLQEFARLDDYDIVSAMKSFIQHEDYMLSFLSKSLINRRLFKVELRNSPFDGDRLDKIRQNLMKDFANKNIMPDQLIFTGTETNSAYSILKDEIKILFKDGKILPMSEASDHGVQPKIITKYFLCYPKNKP